MPRVACYCRVSTEEQNLERQLESTTAYAERELDATLSELEVFRDKSTGTNTERSGYREMMDRVENGEFDAVVVHETSRLARSLQDLDRTVERITDANAGLHFARDNLPPFTAESDPMGRLMLQMLGAFAEWEARVKQMNTKEGIAARQRADSDYHHGRAPFGFEKDDGHLVEGENYHQVVAVLDSVQKGEISKRKAAHELDTSRSTITRALNRAALYGL
mgnify:CR=1 FL=1